MKLLVITTDWGGKETYPNIKDRYGGVGYYRARLPFKDQDIYGQEIKQYVTDEIETAYMEIVQKYDAVLTKQTDNPIAFKAMWLACKKHNKPLIMDLDDDYFNLPEHHIARKMGYEEGGNKRIALSVHITLVDAIFVSTEPLKKSIEKHLENMGALKPVYVLPNCCRPSDWKPQEKSNELVIGWHGSTTHDEDIKMVLPAMERISDEYGAILELVGGIRQEMADYIRETYPKLKVRFVPGVAGWVGFPELIQSRFWTIGLAPILDNQFNRSKSHIKWLEYSLIGVPTIASKVYPYYMPIQGTPTIEDNKTGILAEPDQWYDKIKYLLDNPTERSQIALNATESVKTNWDIERHRHKWNDALEAILA